MVGFSSLQTSSYPPSSTFCFLIAKNKEGSWHDRNLNTPFPAGSGNHCWFDPPVFYHWTTLAPFSLFYSAISRAKLLKTLWITTPLPVLTNLHLWFHLLFFSHWTNLSPFFHVPPGTSKAFPEKLLTTTAEPWTVWLLTSSNLKSWFSLFGSNDPYLNMPYNARASFPLESVLIQ